MKSVKKKKQIAKNSDGIYKLIHKITINSLDGYIKAIQGECKEAKGFLFRGQRKDINWPLLPKIGRKELMDEYGEKILTLEESIFKAFQSRSLLFLPEKERPTNNWDWLALAQHFGLTTRLLDWTSNPLAALWFVVNRDIEGDEHGVVWMLKTDPENYVDVEKDNPFTGENIQIFQPTHITRRIMSQDGWFTVHKYPSSEKKFISLENYSSLELKQFVIPLQYLYEIKAQLSRCGISEINLFQDLEALCRDLNATINDAIAAKKLKNKIGDDALEAFLKFIELKNTSLASKTKEV